MSLWRIFARRLFFARQKTTGALSIILDYLLSTDTSPGSWGHAGSTKRLSRCNLSHLGYMVKV